MNFYMGVTPRDWVFGIGIVIPKHRESLFENSEYLFLGKKLLFEISIYIGPLSFNIRKEN